MSQAEELLNSLSEETTSTDTMDSITLNGADGKQYKLAVDESGALAATTIE